LIMYNGIGWEIITECSPFPQCQCIPPFDPGEYIGQLVLFPCTSLETPL
jgi:hypothetical protein